MVLSCSSIRNQPTVRDLVRAFSIDYRTLALFRVLIGCIIVADLLLRARDFTAFFTDQGVVPRQLALTWLGAGTNSIYFLNGSLIFNLFLLSCSIVFALALIVGYRTRLASVASWLMLVSLHHRTGILSSGADDLMRLLMFWAMFLPLGARFSLDAAMDDAAMEKDPGPSTDAYFSMATIAMLMQVMYVYWVGALLKTGMPWHLENSAVYYALSAEHYSSSLGIWVLNHFEPYLHYVTTFVFSIELYGPLLLVAPVFFHYFRLPVMFMLICMHIGFVFLLNVGHFPFVSICSLLLFLPGGVWEYIERRRVNPRSKNITIYYDQPCDFCLKTVRILKVLLILPQATVQAAQLNERAKLLLEEHDSWVIQKPDGELLIGWQALTWLTGRSPVFFWLSWPLKLVDKLNMGDRIYHWIGDRRMNLGRVTTKILPWRSNRQHKNWLTECIVAVCFLLVLNINLSPVFPKVFPSTPHSIREFQYAAGLWQKWNMFAPRPVRWTQWPVIEGVTEDNREIDIFRQKTGKPDQTKPAHILSEYTNYRWRKFYSRLFADKYRRYRQHYVNYECRRWNHKNRDKQDRVKEIRLYVGTERTLLDPEKEVQRTKALGVYKCRT
ncbi:MAG: hypothetical protein DRR42_08030 [Gammaproteobacteria bacterium]|nr:MAG: hypothetical protein DRR42_08030 [Gammaproteobacteria bacterium]